MSALLYIPWFKPGPLTIPLPFELPLFEVSELHIYPFGVLVATGVLVGMKVAEWYGQKHGVAPWIVADLVWYILLGGFIGAYFLNGLFYEPDRLLGVLKNPSRFFREWLGLSSYGGFIGAAIGGALWRWRRKISFMVVGDAVAFGFPVGWLFGRTGCFVAHDHPGKVTDFFLAVDDYRVGFPPFEPRHDLGLYEVFWSLGAIAVFVALLSRERPRGFYVALLPLLYAPIRFFLDFLRATPEAGGDVRYVGLTPGQWASVVALLGGVALLQWVRRHPSAEIPDDAAWPRREPVLDAGSPVDAG